MEIIYSECNREHQHAHKFHGTCRVMAEVLSEYETLRDKIAYETLRDKIAIAVLKVLLTHQTYSNAYTEYFARDAYKFADAMLQERNKNN